MIRLTERDSRLLRDLVLSHLLSRDQVIELGYFGSVTRANTRLRGLRKLKLVKALDTPFMGQALYAAVPGAAEVVGERLAPLAASRSGSPRFVRHALFATNIRIALLRKGAASWRFEQQCRHSFRHGGREWQVRPDGLALAPTGPVAIEADLGNVDPAKFREKLRGYEALALSGECGHAWGRDTFSLLVVTTSPARASRLARLLPDPRGFSYACRPHDQLGVPLPGAWS